MSRHVTRGTCRARHECQSQVMLSWSPFLERLCGLTLGSHYFTGYISRLFLDAHIVSNLFDLTSKFSPVLLLARKLGYRALKLLVEPVYELHSV